MLQIKGLNKSIKKNKIISDFSYDFNGGAYAILGPNGSGKTTLLRCISQVLPVEKGTIFFDGYDIYDNDIFLDNIGYLPQSFGCFKNLKVKSALELIGNLKGIDSLNINNKIEECLKITNMLEHINSKIGTLSGGTVRRFGIAQAIINEPKYVLLDEPTVGLDPEETINFNNLICKIKKQSTIIVSTHLVEDIEYVFDKIIIISEGKLKFSGCYNDIVSLADGKVYEVPKNDINKLKGDFIIQNQYHKNGLDYLKILSNIPQDFRYAVPNLKDGYICVIKEL